LLGGVLDLPEAARLPHDGAGVARQSVDELCQAITPPPVAARAYYLLDALSGTALAAQSEEDRFEPASLTKLMSAYVVFAAIRDGKPVLEDGRVLDVANVIWSTGYRHDLSWIDLPIFGEDGKPMHERGIVTSEPGLAFVGLPFQFAAASDVLPGVGRDARYVVHRLSKRTPVGVPVAA